MDTSKAIYGRIYLITNLVNGKYYVGQTTSLVKERWGQHVSDAKNRDGHQFLHSALREFGVEAFAIEEVAVAESLERLNLLENAWILSTKSYDVEFGYNRTYGGDSGQTPEVREKIRATLTGRKLTPERRAKSIAVLMAIERRPLTAETRAKIAASLTGKVRSAESRVKQSESGKGRRRPPFTAEHREAIRQSRIGRPLSEEAKRKMAATITGSKRSDEARANMSRAQRALGKTISQEHRAAISARMKGQKRSPEFCARRRELMLGKKQTPEHTAAIAEGKHKAREARGQI